MTGNEMARPNVLAVHLRDDGFMDGCNQYRFRIPFEELRRRVPNGFFDWAPMQKVREWAKSALPVRPTDYDIVLLPRHRPLPYHRAGEADKSAEELPEKVRHYMGQLNLDPTDSHLINLVRMWRGVSVMVGEYDDDYFSGARLLEYEHYDLLYRYLQELSAVTVSTTHLRTLVQRFAPGLPVYVLPNCVMWREWQGHERWPDFWHGRTVIALTGSSTHYHDWQVLAGVIPSILGKYPDAAFMLAGFVPDYLEGIEKQFPEQVAIMEPVQYEHYPALIRQADIVLCPVDPEDEFNQGKSALKAIEGMAAGRPLSNGRAGGAVPITSDLDYYKKAVGGKKRGLVVDHTPESWRIAIEQLLENRGERERLAFRGHRWAYQNRAIETQWHLWWHAYRDIYRRSKL